MSPIPGNTGSQGKKPTTPIIGSATSGNASASVPFTPSSYIGRGTISYLATSTPGNITGTSASSPISVTGLSNGTAYTFTVRGITNYGVSSDNSASSNSVTPLAPPSFPFFPYFEPAPVAPTPLPPTPVAPTPVAPTPVAPTPVAPTPVAPTPAAPAAPSGPTSPGPSFPRFGYSSLRFKHSFIDIININNSNV